MAAVDTGEKKGNLLILCMSGGDAHLEVDVEDQVDIVIEWVETVI